VHDVGEIDGTHYISMGFIEGKELSAFIKPGKPQPIKQIVAVIRKLAIALDEAHQTGIVHRDLKPDNVMIDKRATPIIMDFGLALRDAPGDPRMTQAGSNQLLGTPAYMSPEQVDDDREKVGPTSDVYSLGIMLYEMLTCQLPYQGSVAAVLAQIINANPKPPGQLRPDLDAQLESICLKMMAAKLEDRYGSMREVAKELTAYIKTIGQGGGSSPAAAIPASLPVPVATPVAPTPADDFGFEPLPTINTTDFSGAIKPKKSKTKKPATTRKPTEENVPTSASHSKAPPRWAIISGAAVIGVLFLWGVITLFVSSDNQTVKIEIDDPRAEVFVDGQKITIKNLGADIELAPGPHGYQIRRGDVLVKADSFTVFDGKNEIVRISVLPKQTTKIAKANPKNSKQPVNGNPSAKIASNPKQANKHTSAQSNLAPDPSLTKAQQLAYEWVTTTAVQTYFETFANERRTSGSIWRGGDLPIGAKITRIEFDDDSVLTPATVRHLAELKSLNDLLFSNGLTDAGAANIRELPIRLIYGMEKLTDVGAADLAKIRSLRQIDLSGDGITAKAIQEFSDHPVLNTISLRNCEIDRSGWQAMGNIPNLYNVSIANIKLDATDLESLLRGRAQLALITLDGIKIDDEIAAKFEFGESIQVLRFNDSQLSDAGLQAILRLPKLNTLQFSNTPLTDAGMESIATKEQLQTLRFTGSSVTDAGIKPLAKIPNLRVLDLRNTKVTDQGFATFKGHPRLNQLTLSNTLITDDSIATFLTLKMLASLDVSNTRFTKAGAERLRKVKSNVRVTGATASVTPIQPKAANTPLDPKREEAISWVSRTAMCKIRFPNPNGIGRAVKTLVPGDDWPNDAELLEVSFDSRCKQFPVSELNYLQVFPELESLSISYRQATDDWMPYVAKLKKLKRISCNTRSITDSAFCQLEALTQLESVNCAFSRLGDKGIAIICQLPKLQQLNIGHTQVTSEGFANLRFAKNISSLYAPRHIEDADLDYINHLPLTHLSLSENKSITDVGFAKLESQKNLVDLSLTGTKISDRALQVISRLPDLENLRLHSTDVTNTGLKSLEKMKKLRYLLLEGTEVDDEGLKCLARF
jgi:serine/threonine protein kinase/Leucine-rich repeat (LRR) protein